WVSGSRSMGRAVLGGVGRRARQRRGVDVFDLVGAFGELPAVRGPPVAVVVHGVVQVRAAVAEAPETQDVCAAGRGVAVKLDRARVRGLHEVVPQSLRQLLDPGADLLPAGELGVDGGDPPHAVGCEQRREAVVVAHHPRVGELAAQRLDLGAVGGGLKVAHWVSPSVSSIVFEMVSTSPVFMAGWKRLSVALLVVVWAVDICPPSRADMNVRWLRKIEPAGLALVLTQPPGSGRRTLG